MVEGGILPEVIEWAIFQAFLTVDSIYEFNLRFGTNLRSNRCSKHGASLRMKISGSKKNIHCPNGDGEIIWVWFLR